MYPVDGVRSQIEWNSTLSVSDAPVPTESTKYLRKVSSRRAFFTVGAMFTKTFQDLDYCNYR